MLIVGNAIVSDSIKDCKFCCDLCACKGMCCVDGDSGAPLEESEVPVMEHILPEVKPYMTPRGIEAVEQQGVAVRDKDGDLGTPLIDGGACAFVSYADNGIALCAIERAFRAGVIDYKKPISCHLYPVRIDNYGEFVSVNYHEWDICRCAVLKGRSEGLPLYKYLKEPLIRKFGQTWYNELLEVVEQ